MRSIGRRPGGERLERIRASPLWAGERFRNVHTILPGLRDPSVPMPTLTEFLCGGERRVPSRALPSLNPLETWKVPPRAACASPGSAIPPFSSRSMACAC